MDEKEQVMVLKCHECGYATLIGACQNPSDEMMRRAREAVGIRACPECDNKDLALQVREVD